MHGMTFVIPNHTHRWFAGRPWELHGDEFGRWVNALQPGEQPYLFAFGSKCFVMERPIHFPDKYFTASLDFSFEEIVAANAELVALAPSPAWIAECRRITEESDRKWAEAYMKGDPNVRPT